MIPSPHRTTQKRRLMTHLSCVIKASFLVYDQFWGMKKGRVIPYSALLCSALLSRYRRRSYLSTPSFIESIIPCSRQMCKRSARNSTFSPPAGGGRPGASTKSRHFLLKTAGKTHILPGHKKTWSQSITLRPRGTP